MSEGCVLTLPLGNTASRKGESQGSKAQAKDFTFCVFLTELLMRNKLYCISVISLFNTIFHTHLL